MVTIIPAPSLIRNGSTQAAVVKTCKVAAPEGRLLEAFQSSGSEHGVPARNVGACWVEFAAIEMHVNGDRSKNTGLTGKGWELRDVNIDPLYRFITSRNWNLTLTLRKARHREQHHDCKMK
jgi:hypothetical protein